MNRLFPLLPHRKQRALLPSSRKAGLSFPSSTRRSLMAALFFVTVGEDARLQEQQLHYAVHRQGEKVGELFYHHKTEGAQTTYAIRSDVKVSMLLTIRVQAWEQSVYKNNVLQSSSLVRKVNGRERTNKQIQNTGNKITITSKNNAKLEKNYVINYSTHCLYATEPLTYSSVFSDNYQQFLHIEKLGPQHYSIKFPDGGSNEYFYQNGICRRVKLRSRLFDAEFVLQNP
ncbi:hypothetical protein HRH25_02770 [Flavisolibacter sp. BT320]|nr:hypothetical protein [Flavisolibacter longurius]